MTYYIKVEPHYYDGNKQPYLVTYGHLEEGDYDEIVKFKTVEEAQKVIDKLQDHGDYYLLDHNEYSPPSYTIIQRKDIGDDCADTFDTLEGSDIFYMFSRDGYELVCTCYKLDNIIKEILDNLEVTYMTNCYNIDVYTGRYKYDDETTYMIVYCPKVLAIQLKGGDLGNINWDKPAYFKCREETY